MEHELKCWPESFDAIRDGRKRFEWRRDDRGFAVGDVLVLKKWNPTTRYWFREESDVGNADYPELRVCVTYILRGQFGVPEPFVVMGISDPELHPHA